MLFLDLRYLQRNRESSSEKHDYGKSFFFLQDLRIAKNVEYSQERLKGRKQLNRRGKQRLFLQWPVTNKIDCPLKSYLSFIFRLFSF